MKEPATARRAFARVIARVIGSPRIRLTLLGIIVVGSALLLLSGGGPSRSDIEQTVASAGAAGPAAFVLLYAVLTVLMFPGAVLTAAAGILFGTAWGTALAIVGASLGAMAAFEIGRRLGRDQVERLAGERTTRLDRWLRRRGLLAVLYLRLIPVVPFNVLNYAAGITATRRRDYAVGTVVGIVPGTFAYAALGGNIDDPTSPVFLTAVGLIVLLAVGGPFLNRRLADRGAPVPGPDDESASGSATEHDPDILP